MTAEPEPATELWVYAGVRVGAKGKRVCAWIDPSGKKLLYPQRSANYVIGAVYEANAHRDGDRCFLHGTPKFGMAGDRDDPESGVADYEAADRIARIQLARATQERNAAKRSQLDDAIAPLAEIAAGFTITTDLDALVAYVTRRLHDAHWTARRQQRSSR